MVGTMKVPEKDRLDEVRLTAWLDAKFTIHRVGGGQQRPEWLAAQHVTLPRRVDPVGWVRLAALEAAERDRALETLDIGLQPHGQPRLVQPVLVRHRHRADHRRLGVRLTHSNTTTERVVSPLRSWSKA
jgi:hypothetical protein